MLMRNIEAELPTEKMNLSFSGCGFLGLYHMGVACCFRQYCPQICQNHISGVSAGALVATALACNINLGKSASHILEVAIKARHRALGPFHPNFDINEIMLNALNDVLPDNAHEYVNGKLNISVTRVSDGKNCILSKFESRAELIQAILCSCFIPFWSGYIPPKFQGVAYIDGGFSNNLLIRDEHTISVSPFSGESDICPIDPTYNAFQINISNLSISISPANIYRLTRILFPPHPEVMDKMCQQGFHDALRFLQRNNKISCTRCVAVQSAYKVEDDEESLVEPLIGGRETPFKASSILSKAGPNTKANLKDTIDKLSALEADNDDFISSDIKQDNFKSNLDKLGNRLEEFLNSSLNDSTCEANDELSDEELDEHLEKLMKLNDRIRRQQEKVEKKVKKTHHKHDGDNCKECADLREMVHLDKLPENVAIAIQEACDKVNKGLINYIFKFKIVKILSTLSVPYVLPFDITIVLLCRLRKLLPLLATELSASLRRIIQFVLRMLSRMDSQHLSESSLTNFRYQVAVTEFDYSTEQQKQILQQQQSQIESPRILYRKVSSRSCTAPELTLESQAERRPTLEKSHSFKINRNSSSEELNLLRNRSRRCSVDARTRVQRKSYAGVGEGLSKERNRKHSSAGSREVMNCKPSERILSKMNLGFSMDLNDIDKTSTTSDLFDRQPDLIESSRTLSNTPFYCSSSESSISEHRMSTVSMPCGSFLNPSTSVSIDSHSPSLDERAVQIANKALNKGIDGLSLAAPKLDRLNHRLKEITSSKEALMAFHYKDDDNVVKVTEIFNLSDEDDESCLNKQEDEDEEGHDLDSEISNDYDDENHQIDQSATENNQLVHHDTTDTLLMETNSDRSDSKLQRRYSLDESGRRQRKNNFICRP